MIYDDFMMILWIHYRFKMRLFYEFHCHTLRKSPICQVCGVAASSGQETTGISKGGIKGGWSSL